MRRHGTTLAVLIALASLAVADNGPESRGPAVFLTTVGKTPATDLNCVRLEVPERKSIRRRNTFSIVAYDAEAHEWGVGVASKVLAVGAGTPWARAGAGAIVTQAAANVTYGPRGLELLAKGKTAAEVIKFLTDADDDRDDRQVGLIDARGNAAHFTGKGCDAWAGAKTGKDHVCLGNLLASATTALMTALSTSAWTTTVNRYASWPGFFPSNCGGHRPRTSDVLFHVRLCKISGAFCKVDCRRNS